MGKIRTRTLGLEEEEKKQKEEQKKKSSEKKQKNKEQKDGEREVKEEKQEKKQNQSKTSKVKAHTRGEKYMKAKKIVKTKKIYLISEAVAELKKIKYAGFDESVELHLNIDKEGLKGEVELPNSTGKTIKVVLVNDDVLAQIEKGNIDFDVLVTHPSYMPKLAKYAKVLGPKGLMPNPKAGTVSTDPELTVKKFAKGNLRWKAEAKFPLIHQMIGKISFDDKALVDNVLAFLQSVGKSHIKQAYIKTTMSPSLKLNIEKI